MNQRDVTSRCILQISSHETIRAAQGQMTPQPARIRTFSVFAKIVPKPYKVQKTIRIQKPVRGPEYHWAT